MADPLVSIITINYNCETEIAEHIASVLAQDFESWEHVIVDCASTDNSVNVIESLRHDKLAFFKIGFCGVAEGRNFAIQQAKGKICAILDADDFMLPGRLRLQVKMMNENPGLVAVGGNFIGQSHFVRPISKLLRKARKYFRMPQTTEDIGIFISSALSPVAHSTLSFRTDVFNKLGGYSLVMEKSEDFDLIVRMYYTGGICSVSEAVSVINFGRPGSHTSRHRPKKRDALYYSFFSVLNNYNKNLGLGLTIQEIEEKLDQYAIADLPILQLKWFLNNIAKSKHSNYFGHWKLIFNKILPIMAGSGKISNFRKFPSSAEMMLQA